MDLQLQNKNIIITGGLKGIGGGITLSLAKEGAIPIIISRTENKAFEEKLQKITKNYAIYYFDLKNHQEIEKLTKNILQKFPNIYALVNNAGMNDNLDILQTPVKKLIESYENNLFHYYELTRILFPSIQKNQGNILNIVSKTGITGQGKTSAYASAKAAQIGFTREWACAFAKDNVRVNAIAPAEVMTPLYEKWLQNFKDPKAQYNNIASKIPLGKRFTTIEEIADFATFIISPKSSHTTGQIFHIDGGYVHLDRALNWD
ncbi:SDR family oxidoreductase [Helicobacter anatolicus]|uniref:SDR family oxidoreductase n=1 Tax=Helicobacter anatolicus TaxID=2905874 RepID=UPI001E6298FC|nr:SDR family oxidoreductase [Helicobacter anatolicus]MCE3039772.1 SDR family oxidoreductase [Helicobacter anatolicus]